jgi:uncharacterized protein (TIGR03067 family)
MRWALAVVAMTLAAPLFAAPVPKAIKAKPAATADGVWECVEVNCDGRSEEVADSNRYWRVEGNRMSSGRATLEAVSRPISELRPCTLRIDDPARPTRRTMMAPDGREYPTLFELDGDTLRMAASVDGPITECKPGLSVGYYVLQRVADK